MSATDPTGNGSVRYETLEQLAARYDTTAAWAALARAYPTDSAAIADLAAGTGTTTALGPQCAAAAVALIDPERLQEATAGDDRHAVAGSLKARRRALLTDDIVDGGIALIEQRRTYGGMTPHIAGAALVALASRTDTAAHDLVADAIAASAGSALTLPDRDRYDPDGRATVVHHLLRHGPTTSRDIVGIDLDDLRRAAAHPNAEVTHIAIDMWRLGGTIDDLAAAYHVVHLGDLDDQAVVDWINAWRINHRNDDRHIDAVLSAFSYGGTRTRSISASVTAHTSDALTVDVALSYVGQSSAGTSPVPTTVAHVERWGAQQFADALWRHPIFADEFHRHLAARIEHGGADGLWPWLHDTPIADVNMSRYGLQRWLRDPHIAERLTAAARAAHYDIDDWILCWDHTDGFWGTPEQLVDMLDAVRPHA